MATEFAKKLRKLIDDRDLSDSAVARAIGVASQAIGRWTTNKSDIKPGQPLRRPTSSQMLKLARYFAVSMEYLSDDDMDEPDGPLNPDERAVIAAYRVQRRIEGDSFTPEELGFRIRQPRYDISSKADH